MFVKLSRSLAGVLIIFDCTLLVMLLVHMSVSPSCLANEAHCWFPLLFPHHVTRVQDDTVGIEDDWRKKKESSDRLEQTISAWSKLLSGREHCVQWLERGGTGAGGAVVKQITSTQSFSDTAVHGMEWGCSYMPLITTSLLMSRNGFVASGVTLLYATAG